jgi:hypothetical protein
LIYPLLTNVTAVQAAYSASNPPAQVADLSDCGALMAVANNAGQTFHAVVTGTSGNVSATIHIMVSNDWNPLTRTGNWFDYPTIGTVTVSSGASPQQGNAIGTAVFAFLAAYVSAISGTGASVSLTMNA